MFLVSHQNTPQKTRARWAANISVNFLRRYWGVALIMVMVAAHAAVIGYVRSRISQMSTLESTAIEVGQFRFQRIDDLGTVYQFRLHAVIDPSRLYQGRSRLTQMSVQIREESEQLLRQVDANWLSDPSQTQIRERLMAIVLKYLDEPVVQRVLITDWLQIPVQNDAMHMASR